MLTIVADLGYLLMLCAFVTRDILHLRSILVVAQSLIVVYAWRSGLPVIASWNVVFIGINTAMMVQVLRERRAVDLPPDLRSLYERHFSALSRPEFLRWWRQGQPQHLVDVPLVHVGEHPEWLYFLLEGTARVSREGVTLVDLSRGYFVAEMSLLTGDPANADVQALGAVDVMRWHRKELEALRQRNPALWTKVQSVIGHDLVEKIRRYERRPASAT